MLRLKAARHAARPQDLPCRYRFRPAFKRDRAAIAVLELTPGKPAGTCRDHHRAWLGQHLQAGLIWHGVSLLVVVGVFGLALFESYGMLAGRALHIAGTPDEGRRTLLRSAVVGVVATLATGTVWRLISGTDLGTSDAQPTASGTAAAAPVAETAAAPASSPRRVE